MSTSAVTGRPPMPVALEFSRSDERGAVRFFWAVLILATSASVAGNVTHAVMNASPSTLLVAAAAAVVPPTVLLGATHSVALLVRTRAAGGFTYGSALLMTVTLALCAFVLSFDALRALAITAGINHQFAWLWPLVIDLSIAQATMALLSLSRRVRSAPVHRVGPTDDLQHHAGVANGHHQAAPPRSLEVREDPADAHWSDVAQALARDKRTKIDPAVVAKVLAMTAAQTPPTTIGRRLNVHHTAVRRIQQAAAELKI